MRIILPLLLLTSCAYAGQGIPNVRIMGDPVGTQDVAVTSGSLHTFVTNVSSAGISASYPFYNICVSTMGVPESCGGGTSSTGEYIIGPAGPQGVQGPQGVAGPAGANGADGAVGQRGTDGTPGATGAAGAKGDKGDKGDTGLTGSNGLDAFMVRKGTAVVTVDVPCTNTANTLKDITELSFPVVAGSTYSFRSQIIYVTTTTTTGARFTVMGPTAGLLAYTSRYPLTATTETVNHAVAYDIPAASNATSLLLGNFARIEGIFRATGSGTFTVRFASELAGTAPLVIVKSGSKLEWW